MTESEPPHTLRPGPQAGILSRPPEHVIVAAFDFVPTADPAAARMTVDALRDLVRREMRSDLDNIGPSDDKTRPTQDSGILGVEDHFDRRFLTITVGLSHTGYAALGVGAEDTPQDLTDVPWALIGDTPTGWDGAAGDLVVQLCSDDVYVLEHTLRRIEHTLGTSLVVRWTAIGSQRYTTRTGRVAGHEARALIGFHDGINNLDPAHSDEDRALVFVDPDAVPTYPATPVGQQPAPTPGQPGYGTSTTGPKFPDDLRQPPTREPAGTKGGTYMFVRVSAMDMTSWDNEPLDTQQTSVGRFKFSGAPLDLADDPVNLHADPAFAADAANTVVPVDSHLRKANPRSSPEDAQRRIFRRGYPLLAAATGTLRRGLLFISFSRTTSSQPEFILRGWMRNPDFPAAGGATSDKLLDRDTQVSGGGYYFVPALDHVRDPGSFHIPDASQ